MEYQEDNTINFDIDDSDLEMPSVTEIFIVGSVIALFFSFTHHLFGTAVLVILAIVILQILNNTRDSIKAALEDIKKRLTQLENVESN
jgi:Na+/citrate or Na+/malate symporter